MSDSIETSIEGPRKAGLVLFVLIFVFFGGWSTLAPIEGAAVASGVVRVGSYSKVVQHLEGGIVEKIYVKNGDPVKQGDALIALDDMQSQAQLEISLSQFVSLNVTVARLLAERDYAESFSLPSRLFTKDIDFEEEFDAQQSIFLARRAANFSNKEVLERRIQQLREKINGLTALKVAKEQLADSFQSELDDIQTLLARGFTNKLEVRELERNVAIYQGEAADLAASISSAKVQIGETELQILQDQNEFHNQVVSELSEAQSELRAVNERINASTDVVRRMTIRAPTDGIVNGMQFHTVGGVIGAGSIIAEIVPQKEELVIEAKVSPNDIDRVANGQDASIRFSAFGNKVPTISGTLTGLSADAVVQDSTSQSYYLATITVVPESLEELGGMELLPGMQSDVFIATGSRTFLQYLFKPVSNGLARSFNED